MSISDNIRLLAKEGLSVADIARRLGIRYQHAYKVLKDNTQVTGGIELATKEIALAKSLSRQKPTLPVAVLIQGGFQRVGRWMLSAEGNLLLEQPLAKDVGVYAFARLDVVLYVGVATIGLAKRLYSYGRPGIGQLTNIRLNAMIKSELVAGSEIEIFTACPPDLEWNGLPVHGSAGLELGLIKKYTLPWNVRSAANAIATIDP